jgi:hypothetical protein
MTAGRYYAEEYAGGGYLVVVPTLELRRDPAVEVGEDVAAFVVLAQVAGCSGEALVFEELEELGRDGRLRRGRAPYRVSDPYDALGEPASGQRDHMVGRAWAKVQRWPSRSSAS